MNGAPSIQVEALLATIPLFSSLGPEALGRMAQGTRQVQVAKHQFVAYKGDDCNGLHLIVRGQIKLVFCSPLGSDKVAEILGEGQSFGEAQMFADKPYFASAQATCDSLLLHCPKALIFREMESYPGLRLRMLAGMSVRLHQLMTEIETLSFHSGVQRVVGYLLRELPAAGAATDAVIALHATKGNIASRLNLTHEHFCRILNQLSKRELLEVQGGRVVIPDVDKLRAYHDQAGSDRQEKTRFPNALGTAPKPADVMGGLPVSRCG